MADDVFDYSTTAKAEAEAIFAGQEPSTPARSGVSPLDRLREKVTKRIERPEIFIDVPERPGVLVKVSPNITQEQMKAWRKNSGENSKAGFDSIKFACYVIGATTRGIYVNDEEVLTDAGNPVSFASQEVMDMTDTLRPIPDCVRAFFGLDPHVEAAAVTIMDRAGWGDDVDAVDPTKTPSTNS